MRVSVVWCYLKACFQNALSVKEWRQERCYSVTLSVVWEGENINSQYMS
jgi:hypothetical protein